MNTLRECLQSLSQMTNTKKRYVKDYSLYREKLVMRAAQGMSSVYFIGKLPNAIVKALEKDGLTVEQSKNFCPCTIVSWE